MQSLLSFLVDAGMGEGEVSCQGRRWRQPGCYQVDNQHWTVLSGLSGMCAATTSQSNI